jgi:outer membrane receptor protein involved in Fe transport
MFGSLFKIKPFKNVDKFNGFYNIAISETVIKNLEIRLFSELIRRVNRRYAAIIAAFVFFMVLMLSPATISGQVLYGSLAGNITDPADAAVPGAKVEVTNLNTGDVKTVTTDERGSYLFSDLQPGVYKVLVTMASFKTAINESIAVVANNTVRFDTKLEVGDVNATVVVSSESEALLQTDRTDVNVVQTSRQVNDLPLTGSQGRNYQSLLTIVPGASKDLSQSVIANGAGEANSAAGNPQRSISFNVNGVSRLQNNTRIDGSAVNYPWLPTNTAYVPTAESIQEVNIVTNAFDAEQGLAGGVVVNVITKSGTNGFHGAGWGYVTNSTIGKARNYFQTTPQNAKDILAQYGYAVGGPIWKNKLFFFTDLERTTRNNLSRVNRVSVAPASLRPGPNGVDFSFLLPPGTDCNAVSPAPTGCIFDPLSNPNPQLRTAFPGNIIPLNRISPAAATLISLLPMPTQAGFADNFISQGVATFKRTNFDNKINWNASDKMQIWGRLSFSPTNIFEAPILGEAGGDALNGGQLGTAPGKVYVFSVGGSYAINPNIIYDGVFGYTLQHLGAEFDLEENYGLDVLHIPGTNGPDRLQGGKPAFQISSWANIGNPNTGNPFLFNDKQFTTANNLSWTKGAHSFRFGLDYQKQRINHFQPQGADFQTVRGTFRFNGNSTLRQNLPLATNYDIRYNSWADFLLGLPNTAGKADQLRNPNAVYMTSYALYARDRWQINKNLTLNFGLRWERYLFPDKDTTGINRFDPDDGLIYTGGLSGVPRDTGASSGIGQFLPRVGIAYQWGEKTVIRAGYGQSADPRPFIDFRNAYPIVNVWQMPQINGNAFIPVTSLTIGLINPSVPPDLTQGILSLPANTGTTTYPREPQRKAIHSFTFIVQRELPWRFVASVGYVGTRAIGQMGFININASAPGTGVNGRPLFQRFGLRSDINMILPYKTTTYDSLQAELKRRWGGSTFGLAYTLSKTTNYADNDANPRIQYMPEAERNKGLAGYDRRHNLQIYGVYDLPFGKGQRWANNGWLTHLVGGWQLNGIVSLMSGTPINIVQGNAFNLNAGGSGQYPDQVLPEVRILGGIGLGNPYFDRSAFAVVNIPANQPQRFGSAGRNNIIGPGFFNVDLGLFKTISFGERFKLQLRAEALNALNHPNFGNPQGDITNSNFGFITSTVGIGERNMRFAARFIF